MNAIMILILGVLITRMIITQRAEVKPTFKEEAINVLRSLTFNFAMFFIILIILNLFN
jgi:uncharacterized membrane protein